MAIDGSGSTRGLGRRVLVTLGALFLYRLGCQIPLPGLDVKALIGAPGAPVLSAASLSIFALGVLPIFSAALVAEIAKLAFPALGGWAHLRRTILIVALALAAAQGFGIANALEQVPDAVAEPGWPFLLETVATLVAATALLGWLAERITRRGIGDGFWLLLIAPFLAQLPRLAVLTFELARMGAASPPATFVGVGYCLLAGVLIIPLALTRVEPASFSFGGEESENRANGAGFMDVWPPLLAHYVGSLLISMLALATGQKLDISSFAVGSPIHILITAILIAGFAYLRAPRGGDATQAAILAALAQIAICCIGEALSRNLGLPFAIDGAWLIVVVVTLTRIVASVIAPPRVSLRALNANA